MLSPSDILPFKTRLLVKKYTLPEKIGSIVTNPAWRTNNSRALWEVVFAPPKAEEYLGMELPPDTILVTLPNRGTFVETSSNIEHYILLAEEVVKVVVWA